MRRPIRVAVFTTCIEFGGIEGVLLNLFRNMDSAVELYPIVFTRTDTKDRTFFDSVAALGITYDTLYVNTNYLKYMNPVRNVGELMAILRRKRVDLIHSHGYRADMLAVVLARYFGLPTVSMCHGFISNDSRLRLYNWLDVFVLRRFTRIISVSAQMKEHLVANGVREDKIDVITNAVDTVSAREDEQSRHEIRLRLGIGRDDFVFGFVGRLSEEKGVESLIRAAAARAAGNGRSRLLIVGDGPARSRLQQAARALGIQAKTHFVGFQSRTAPWYAAMDAFVLPSLTEGTPVALLEAMSHRLPVIASAVGGVPAVVSDQVDGILVPAADVNALTRAMGAVAHDPALRRRLSDGAAQTVHRCHDVQAWSRKIRDVYVAALEQVKS